MPKTFVGLKFDNYNPDYGGSPLQLNSYRFQLPESLDNADNSLYAGIATAVGADIRYIGDQVFDNTKVPCPDSSGGFKPRKLKFVLSDGTSFAIPFADIGAVKSAAESIRGTVNAINGTVTVVCISLIGEEWANLNDVLGVNYDAGAATPEAGSSSYYSGYISYASDLDVTVPHPVKVMTASGVPAGSQPPAIFSSTWGTCVTSFISNSFSCPVGARSNPREHRRYIVKYNAEGEKGRSPETRELPVNSTDPAAIKSCGESVAGNTSVFCIGYRGESYRFVHKLLTNP